ncbi:MAG: amidohydrolase [Actinomycetota bacterium]|nr:amidohydrolase [Actinomycetota bacterium]
MNELIRLRREIHAHPELARQERRTTALVARTLGQAGLNPKVLPSGTGLTCDIGEGSGPVIALRADLDALPIQDDKIVDYKSQNPGVSHACGHDVHTAILTGAAIRLAQENIGTLGRVRCIFQPAEESSRSGSLDVIAAGAIKEVDVIYALHCDPSAHVGRIGTRVGPITSAQDRITVKVRGSGGHSARPNLTPNPINVIGTVVVGLSDAVNMQLAEDKRMLIGFGEISSNGTKNAIPSRAEASGTVRIRNADIWPEVPKLVEDTLAKIVAPFGLDWELEYTRVCPAVNNNPKAIGILRNIAVKLFGEDNVYEAPQSFGGEDFGWYLKHVPGALCRLGVRSPGNEAQADLHSGLFDIDERAIPVGVDLFVQTALSALKEYISSGKEDVGDQSNLSPSSTIIGD